MVLFAPKFGNRLVNLVAGGWEWGNVFTATTGGRFTASTGADVTLAGTGNTIAYNAAQPYGSRTNFGTHGYLTAYAIPSGGTAQTSNWPSPTVGTFSYQRPLSLVGPSSYEWDMSVSRNFAITESQKVQFRWDVFNVPNEVILTTPTATVTSSAFGNFTTSGNPRIMQVALKYTF
jgi:hypothetical protein